MISAVLLAAALAAAPAPVAAGEGGRVTSLPEDPQALCPMMRVRLYAGCADQRTLFIEALIHARAAGKTLLVSYGAEWCIWCHLIDAELAGLMPGDATAEEIAVGEELSAFAAEHFVIVHIDAEAPVGATEVLEATGAAAHYGGGIPFMFTVDDAGRFAAAFRPEEAETVDRQGRPVHDRAVLLPLLRALVPEVPLERTRVLR